MESESAFIVAMECLLLRRRKFRSPDIARLKLYALNLTCLITLINLAWFELLLA
jgi:hypothetical protein